MIDRLVVWGGTTGLESHRWIHRAFHQTAGKLGIRSVWVADKAESMAELTPGTTVIAADIWAEHLRPVAGVNYVLHNFDGSHPVCRETPPGNLLRIQVWTSDAVGEYWDQCRTYDRDGQVLYQPWGTDVLAEEFMEPVFNVLSRDVVFVGAVWGEVVEGHGELGNVEAIDGLDGAVTCHGLALKRFTHIADRQMVNVVRGARLAPAVAGAWQVNHSYLPCRGFKNSSYGALMISNVPAVQRLYGEAVVKGETIEEMIGAALRIKRKESDNLVRAQQRVTRRYTYRESLNAIGRALEEGR